MKMKHRINATKFSALILSIMLIVPLTWSCDTTGNDAVLSEEMGSTPELSSGDENDPVQKIMKEVDVKPEPAAGLEDFLSYMADNLTYPEKAKKAGIQGKVFVDFIVDSNGDINNVKTVKGLGHGLDEEAERVIANYEKKWNPGVKDGKKVNTRMVLPVNFAL